MSSSDMLERGLTAPAAVRDLLVLWQHPETRAILPIGRFTHGDDTYTFAYTRAAAQIPGFRPLPGLRDLHQPYVAPGMPAVFEQRVMDPRRPDFATYLTSIGLDADHASPWEQIVHSGGRRAGDTLQFMQVPAVRDGHVRAQFLANGLRHVPLRTSRPHGREVDVSPEEHEAALLRLEAGSPVRLAPEVDNSEDPDAVLVTAHDTPLGYVPQVLSAGIRRLMDHGLESLTVLRLGPPSSPPHVRLVLEVDSAAPEGFTFDPNGDWKPLVVPDGVTFTSNWGA